MPANERFFFLESPAADALAAELHRLQGDGKKTVLILACAANNYSAEELTPLLQSLDMTVLGAVFPSVILGAQLYETGTLLISYDSKIPTTVFPDISRGDHASIVEKLNPQEQSSLIVLADALCGGIETFIDGLYHHLGTGLRVIGGGAGSMDFVQRPCLFCNQGFIEDAAIVTFLPQPLDTTTGHGWEILDGPYVVTESDGHNIISINYQPAFDLYNEAIRRLSGRDLTQEGFFEVAMNFPFGISELNGEMLVRDPIVSQDGSITFVGNVPQNATVYILQGDQDKLINAALDTSKSFLQQKEHAEDTVILFDCISRQIYLGDRVTEELVGIEEQLPPDNHLVGAFTLGEIVNRQGGPVQLMNKSLVLGTF